MVLIKVIKVKNELEKEDSYSINMVAPHHHMSAKSHSVTIFEPIIRHDHYNKKGKLEAVSLTGTPADCVSLALTNILASKPDIVVSGINDGGNFSTISLLSGTDAAAEAGVKHGITSIAVSLLSGFAVRQKIDEKMDEIKRYMKCRSVNRKLERKVVKWLDYLYTNQSINYLCICCCCIRCLLAEKETPGR